MPASSKTCRASISSHIGLLVGSSSPGHRLMGGRPRQDLKELYKRGTQIEVSRRCHVFSRMSCVGIWISSSLGLESRVIPTSA